MDTLPVDLPRQVGLYIRRARTAQGLTRAQLAGLSGVSERSIASIELGDAPGVRLDKLLSIYKALDLSLLTQGENISKESEDAAKTQPNVQPRPNRKTSQAYRPKYHKRPAPVSPATFKSDYYALYASIAEQQGSTCTKPPKLFAREEQLPQHE